MKKYMIALIGTAFLLGACGGNDGNVNDEVPANDVNNEMNDEAANNEEAGGEYDLAAGEEIYVGNCASCHGSDLSGGSAPGIQGLSYDEVMAAIENGPGTMPSNIVTGEDAENVAAWVAEQ